MLSKCCLEHDLGWNSKIPVQILEKLPNQFICWNLTPTGQPINERINPMSLEHLRIESVALEERPEKELALIPPLSGIARGEPFYFTPKKISSPDTLFPILTAVRNKSCFWLTECSDFFHCSPTQTEIKFRCVCQPGPFHLLLISLPLAQSSVVKNSIECSLSASPEHDSVVANWLQSYSTNHRPQFKMAPWLIVKPFQLA